MLKTLNMVQFRCPLGFSEKINAVFQMKKKTQIDTEKDKNPKIFYLNSIIFHFSKFLRICCQILDALREWSALRGQQGKDWLSGRLSQRVYCIFLSGKDSN